MTKNGNYFKLHFSNHKQLSRFVLENGCFVPEICRKQKYLSQVKFFRCATFLKIYPATKIFIKITEIVPIVFPKSFRCFLLFFFKVLEKQPFSFY